MSQHESRGDAQHKSSPADTSLTTNCEGSAQRRRSGRPPWYARIASGIRWGGFALIYAGVLIGIAFLVATRHPVMLPAAPAAPTMVYSSDGKPLAPIFDELHLPVKLADIPMHTIYAVLAAEDAHFFEHKGLDWHGLLRVGWVNLHTFHLSQDSRTITQQLVGMNLLTGRPSLLRDVREGILAVRLERAYDKYTLLERYLNTVYFGSGVYGIGAAAKFYFDKPVDKLTPAESAVLAGIIGAPGEGNPRDNVQLPRQRVILAAMQRHQWLSQEDYTDALNEKLVVQPHRMVSWPHPYVLDAVRQQLISRYGHDVVYRRGLAVYTTIDPRLQDAAEQALAHVITAGKMMHVNTGALAAIEPHTGAIRALVGGVNFQQSQFNRALLAHRQAGSAFNVFVYQAALDRGHLLFEQALDAPITVDGWTPKNRGGQYLGVVTLRTALAQSLTSVAVRLTQQLSPRAVVTAANNAGITSSLQPNIDIALGSTDVTPLEMARVFATYANDGRAVDPSLITEIHVGDRVLFRQRSLMRQSVTPDTAFLLTQGLRQVLLQGTGKHADLGRPAAGMPGVSSDARDAWFIGYTPNLSTAVWLGNDDHHPMLGVEGETLPAQAWSAFMHQAHLRLPVSDFPVPDGMKLVALCADSHQLALPVCPHVQQEYLPMARVPGQLCQMHYWVTRHICVESGKLATSRCPETANRTFPYNKVPTEYCPLSHAKAHGTITTPQPVAQPVTPEKIRKVTPPSPATKTVPADTPRAKVHKTSKHTTRDTSPTAIQGPEKPASKVQSKVQTSSPRKHHRTSTPAQPPQVRRKTTAQTQITAKPVHQKKTTPVHQKSMTPVHPRKATPVHPKKTTPNHARKTTPVHPRKTTPVQPRKTTPATPKENPPAKQIPEDKIKEYSPPA